MLKLLQRVFVITLILNTAWAMAHDEAKIAVVDLERVVALSPQGQALQHQLEGFQKQAQQQVENMNNKLKEIQRQAQDGANSLSEDKLAELQREYEDQTINIRRFTEEKQREGQQMQQKGLKEIEKQLEPVMKKIQTDYGYDLILNNTPGIVVMSSDKVDITQLVIDNLKQSGN